MSGLARMAVRQMRGPCIAVAALVTASSTGYVIIEDWAWFDALYMSVITIGQVGFNEVYPLSTAGRSWTIATIVLGFAVFVYTAASLTALYVSGEVAAELREKRRSRVREQLREHIIVVGFGRVGRAAVEAAVRSDQRCVVIDADARKEAAIARTGAVYLHGDARDATVLHLAGITRATALITSLDDPSNAVVALTARSISPTLRIVARTTDADWRDRLMRAGASHVVPVYESIGASLTATALDAEVVGVLPIPGTDMRIEEIEVGAGSRVEGSSLRALGSTDDDVHVLGLRRSGTMVRWPDADEPLASGDMLVVLGTPAGLARITAVMRHGSLGGGEAQR
ncbi:MAG: potassium channel family protein [Ilumatobacteraceae bacterium]